MPKINEAVLNAVYTAFTVGFNKGLGRATSFYDKVAMITQSTTAENSYAWLGEFPQIREWIGDRVINTLSTRGYTIVNRLYENTITVPRTKIEDDQFGIYGPVFDEMGKDTADHPNKMISEVMLSGFDAPCYDGQNFFDQDHPVLNEQGERFSASNHTPGTGPGWYLIDGTRAVGAFIYQKRVDFELERVDDPSDGTVFLKDKFLYGVRGRSSAGYGFWQLAHGSRAPLTEANFVGARQAMTTMKGDYGRKLGIRPNMLVVPTALETAGKNLVEKANLAGGESNIWAGSVELVVTPWLDS